MLRSGLEAIIDDHIAAAAVSLQEKSSQKILATRLRLEGQYTVSMVAETLLSCDYDAGFVQDLLISLGEKLSCLCMVAILRDLVRITCSLILQH